MQRLQRQMDRDSRWDSAIDRLEIKYGLHLDDWKRLGRDQMGQKCGRGWYGLRGACKRGKKGADNSAAIKDSKLALADKIRKRKGLTDRNAPKVEDDSLQRLEQLIALKKTPQSAAVESTPKPSTMGGSIYDQFGAVPIGRVRKEAAKVARSPSSVPKAKPDRPAPFSLGLNDLDQAYGPELERFASQAKAHPRYKTVQKVLDKMEKAEKAKNGASRLIDPVTALTGTYNPKDYLGYEYLDYAGIGRNGKKRPNKVKAMTEKDIKDFSSATSAINKKLGFEAEPSAWNIADKFSNRSDSDDSLHFDAAEIVRYTRAIASLNDRYGWHIDAQKVLSKLGKKLGKKCGGGWISPEKKCKSHYTNGKLNESGKASGENLADRIRQRKKLATVSRDGKGKELAYAFLPGNQKQSTMTARRTHAPRSGYQTPGRLAKTNSTEERRSMVGLGQNPGTRSKPDTAPIMDLPARPASTPIASKARKLNTPVPRSTAGDRTQTSPSVAMRRFDPTQTPVMIPNQRSASEPRKRGRSVD